MVIKEENHERTEKKERKKESLYRSSRITRLHVTRIRCYNDIIILVTVVKEYKRVNHTLLIELLRYHLKI